VFIKSILVPLIGDPIDEPALELAMVAARQFDAHIEGMYCRVSSEQASSFVSSRLDTSLYTEVVKKLQAQMEQEEREARQNFAVIIERESIEACDDPSTFSGPSASWCAAEGDPVDVMARDGGAFDLIVTSHPTLSAQSMPNQVLDTAIFNTARPVLLASDKAPDPIGQSVLLAWNRGIQAGRALISAIPFLKRAGEIVILTVTTEAKQGPEPEAIAKNLAWHGVSAEVKRVPPDRRGVGEVLLDEAHEIGADLLVMGAYSQSRLRDRIPGGVTKAILTRADLPVLMAR
jgi:nucleotide-binding universal stress UspA family protein